MTAMQQANLAYYENRTVDWAYWMLVVRLFGADYVEKCPVSAREADRLAALGGMWA